MSDLDPQRALVARQALHDRVENDLMLHPPLDEATAVALNDLRSMFTEIAHHVVDVCPPSRELSLALTDIEDALQHSIAAIVRNQANGASLGG